MTKSQAKAFRWRTLKVSEGMVKVRCGKARLLRKLLGSLSKLLVGADPLLLVGQQGFPPRQGFRRRRYEGERPSRRHS